MKIFIGDKIYQQRTNLKLNRQKFIDQLNELIDTSYTSQALYSWEKGVSIPPADIVPPLAYLLKINILELFVEEDRGYSTQAALSEEYSTLEAKAENQARQILKLEGKLEASEAIMDKLLSQFSNADQQSRS